MGKYMGNYTNEATKTLKGSERIICRMIDDGAVYVTNDFIAHETNPPEYTAIVQPVTRCEAGNYIMQNNEKAADNGFDLVKLFNKTVEQTANAPAPERCPLALQADKALTASYYSPTADVASFYNAKFTATLTPSAALRTTSAISAAAAHVGGEPLVLALPTKPEPKTARVAKAYLTECNNDATAEIGGLRVGLAQAQSEPSAVHGNPNQTTNKAAKLEAQQTAPAVEQPEPKTATELITARSVDLVSVITTIKDAQAAAPMMRLTGGTERHAGTIKAAGAEWSSRKSAYYVHVA